MHDQKMCKRLKVKGHNQMAKCHTKGSDRHQEMLHLDKQGLTQYLRNKLDDGITQQVT